MIDVPTRQRAEKDSTVPKRISLAGLSASFRNRPRKSNSPRARSLRFEALEERHLLTVASVCAYDALAAEGSIADMVASQR